MEKRILVNNKTEFGETNGFIEPYDYKPKNHF